MDFKKKTIIGEDNNEPPKDYIGAKKDGKFYEYSYATRSWIESKLIKAEESGGSDGDNEGGSGDDSGNLLMSLIPSNCPKPDLFLYQRDSEDTNFIDVTNYKIDDFLNLYEQEEQELFIMCLYESPDFSVPIIEDMQFAASGYMYFNIIPISDGNVLTNEVSYNNKVYYYYSMNLG